MKKKRKSFFRERRKSRSTTSYRSSEWRSYEVIKVLNKDQLTHHSPSQWILSIPFKWILVCIIWFRMLPPQISSMSFSVATQVFGVSTIHLNEMRNRKLINHINWWWSHCDHNLSSISGLSKHPIIGFL